VSARKNKSWRKYKPGTTGLHHSQKPEVSIDNTLKVVEGYE
jgi:hypothetical protein